MRLSRPVILSFVSVCLLSAILLLPLKLVAVFALSPNGTFGARDAAGTIWKGRLVNAALVDRAIGDVSLALKPLATLSDGLTFEMAWSAGKGTLRLRGSAVMMENVTAQYRLQAHGSVTTLGLTNGAIEYGSSGCLSASGNLSARSPLMGGNPTAGRLTCEAGKVVAVLDGGLQLALDDVL